MCVYTALFSFLPLNSSFLLLTSASNFWVDRVIGELVTDDSLTSNAPFSAVFFDEVDQGYCGETGGGSGCDFTKFPTAALQEASNAMLVRMVEALNAAGITPILSMDNRMKASSEGLAPAPSAGSAPCAVSEDANIAALANTTWVRFYENWPSSFWHAEGPDEFAAMVANAILEGQHGVANVLRYATSQNCPAASRSITRPGPLGGALEFAVASYLIVATPGTTLSVSNGWYDESFCWRSEFDVEYVLRNRALIISVIYRVWLSKYLNISLFFRIADSDIVLT